jgi:sec-independent protein translocase protein TatA
MFNMGPAELIIVALVILLLFGAKRIPEMMQGLGKGIKEFKSGLTDLKKETDVKEK